jgi:DNA-binding transcriptional MerR regulator
MNKEDIIKIKTLKDNGFSCSQIQEQMPEYSFQNNITRP